MPKSVKHSNLEFPKARARLKSGRQPHWQALTTNGVHLGYQRSKGKGTGRWILRRYLGNGNQYRITPLGLADDDRAANGSTVLDYAQAQAKARAMIDTPDGDRVHRMTVKQAFDRYVDYKKALGQSVADVMSRGTAHILPPLGDSVVAELTAKRLQLWLSTMAATPAQSKPKRGKVQYRPEPEGDDAIRKRRATANRVLTMLKAILNYAFDEQHVSNCDAWGRRLKPFKKIGAGPARYLSIAEAQRLINAADKDFRPLVRAALETGCRYMELARLVASDFNRDSGTLHIRKSKSGEERHIILTDEGAAFFKAHTVPLSGNDLMFTHADGSPWKTAQQGRPMREACHRAKLKPMGIHGMRHTWASHAVMNGVPLMVVAKNMGHVDTRMVERVYGHLAPSYIVDAIRAGAPKYGITTDRKVVTIK